MRVGVVAVDPSSPFSGGAVLGDRIRMHDHYQDKGVFIRSLGSRGSSGGLSLATSTLLQLLDAYGMDIIIVETVGVGQTELDIMNLVDTTFVLLVPESGDTIQTMKAGILEIADIFVVNKADRPDANRMAEELRFLSDQHYRGEDWDIPVLLSVAHKAEGIDECVAALQSHQQWSKAQKKDKSAKGQQALKEFYRVLAQRLEKEVKATLQSKPSYRKLESAIKNGQLNPYDAFLRIAEGTGWSRFLKSFPSMNSSIASNRSRKNS